jgi:osmotically-inducible protein OsmY
VRIISRRGHYPSMKRLLVLALLFTFSMFCAPPAAVGRRSDTEIEATIRGKLAKSKIGKDGFQVHVRNGIATWQGNTTVPQHKGAATRMAKTAGAVQVVNNIKVSGATGIGVPRKVEVKTN